MPRADTKPTCKAKREYVRHSQMCTWPVSPRGLVCGNSYWEPQAVFHPLPSLPFPLAHVYMFPSHHLGHHDSPQALWVYE